MYIYSILFPRSPSSRHHTASRVRIVRISKFKQTRRGLHLFLPHEDIPPKTTLLRQTCCEHQHVCCPRMFITQCKWKIRGF